METIISCPQKISVWLEGDVRRVLPPRSKVMSNQIHQFSIATSGRSGSSLSKVDAPLHRNLQLLLGDTEVSPNQIRYINPPARSGCTPGCACCCTCLENPPREGAQDASWSHAHVNIYKHTICAQILTGKHSVGFWGFILCKLWSVDQVQHIVPASLSLSAYSDSCHLLS